MSRKRHEEEHENAERWLLTYADMITLLMAFFILMYTMSQVDAQKVAKVANAVKNKLGGAVSFFPGVAPPPTVSVFQANTGTSNMPAAPKMVKDVPRLSLKDLKRTLKRNKLEEEVKLRMDERGLVISLMTDGILFDVQSATLKPMAERVLDAIGIVLEAVTNRVAIEGHTDEQRAQSRADPIVNWNLSSARALSVLNFLMKKNYVVEPRLQLAAYAANRPVANNIANPEERNRLNRRVDIIIMGNSPYMARTDLSLKDLQHEIEIGW